MIRNEMFLEVNVRFIEIIFVLLVLWYLLDSEVVILVVIYIFWDNENWWNGGIYRIIFSIRL